MNEYMKNNIVNYAWHQFLYGIDTKERKEFLNSMLDDYPVKLDSDAPAAIHVNDFMLPIVEGLAQPDTYRVQSVAREFFSFTLVSDIVEQTVRQVGIDALNERMEKFIKSVNRLLVSNDDMTINDLEGFRKALLAGKQFYLEQYFRLMETGEFKGDFSTLPISFMDLNMFASYFKRALGMSKHFAVIVDCPHTGAVVSQRAVNDLITRRITADYSMKVMCQPEEWRSYFDLNGVMAEDVHDYSVVDLDGSYHEYVKKLMKKNGINEGL